MTKCSIKKMWSRVRHIALYGNMHSVRLTLAMAELFWVIALLWPGDTFARPTYRLMGEVAGEATWSVIFLVTAACQWKVLLTGQYHTRFAVGFAAWNMCLWLFVTMSMYLSVYPPPAGISGELALSLASGWVFVRAGALQWGRRHDDVR